MINLLLWSKKFHRLLVLPIFFMTILMAFTGLMLREPFNTFTFIDYGWMRYIHNEISIVFTLVLVVMSISGIVLYVVPIVRLKQINDKEKIN